MPVVIKHGTGGVLFHEACGHGLEADHVAKGAQRLRAARSASSSPRRSSRSSTTARWPASGARSAIDDEGHPSQCNVLIEDGVLTDYMWDYLRSRKEGRAPSRQRSPAELHAPADGADDQHLRARTAPTIPTTSSASTDHGVYVAKLGGGSVNTATGDFVFGMTEAYLIENGEITEPLREGNLIGNGPQVLRDIDMLGNDFAMGNPGTCGKDGQGVPVGDGQPTLRVKSLTIGGTAA